MSLLNHIIYLQNILTIMPAYNLSFLGLMKKTGLVMSLMLLSYA